MVTHIFTKMVTNHRFQIQWYSMLYYLFRVFKIHAALNNTLKGCQLIAYCGKIYGLKLKPSSLEISSKNIKKITNKFKTVELHGFLSLSIGLVTVLLLILSLMNTIFWNTSLNLMNSIEKRLYFHSKTTTSQ